MKKSFAFKAFSIALLMANMSSTAIAGHYEYYGFENPNGWKQYVHWYNDEVDGIYYSFSDNGEAIVVGQGSTEIYYSRTSDYQNNVQFYYEMYMGGSYSGKVVIPEKVTFEGTEYVVTCIDDGAFYGCSNLTSIEIPATVEIIGDQYFGGESMDGYLYSEFTNLADIRVKPGNTHYTVRDNALVCLDNNSVSMASVKASRLPNGIRIVESGYNCNNTIAQLTSFRIPDSVRDLYCQFSGYNTEDRNHTALSWTSLYVGPEPASISSKTFSYVDYDNCTLFVPKGCKEAYQKNYYWNQFKNIVEIEVEATDISEYNNIIYAEDIHQWPGKEVELPLHLKNLDYDVIGFQCTVVVPSGVKITDIEGLTEGYVLESQDNYSQTELKLVSYSAEYPAAVIAKGDEVVVKLTLAIDEHMSAGECPIIVKDVKLNLTDDTSDYSMSEAEITSLLTICFSKLGDANGDGDINVGDITSIIAAIYNEPSDNYVSINADITGDGAVNINDIVVLVDYILGRWNSYLYAPSRSRDVSPTVPFIQTTAGQEIRLPIMLSGIDFNAFQLDLQLPEGFHMARYEMANDYAETHQLEARMSESNSLRLLSFSMDNDIRLSNTDEVAYLVLTTDADIEAADYNITLSDIIVSGNTDTQCLDSYSYGISIVSPSCIEDVRSADDQQPTFDLMGRRANKGLVVSEGIKSLRF